MLWKLFKRKPILFLYVNNTTGEDIAEIRKSVKAEVGRDYYVIVANQNRDCLHRSPWELIK
jgi:hypothetical protein